MGNYLLLINTDQASEFAVIRNARKKSERNIEENFVGYGGNDIPVIIKNI